MSEESCVVSLHWSSVWSSQLTNRSMIRSVWRPPWRTPTCRRSWSSAWPSRTTEETADNPSDVFTTAALQRDEVTKHSHFLLNEQTTKETIFHTQEPRHELTVSSSSFGFYMLQKIPKTWMIPSMTFEPQDLKAVLSDTTGARLHPSSFTFTAAWAFCVIAHM